MSHLYAKLDFGHLNVTFMVCDGLINAQSQELLGWQGPAVI
jgi:hypothetical protein